MEDRPRLSPLWIDLLQFAPKDPHGPLFPSTTGTAMGSIEGWRIVKRAAKKAGMPPDFSPMWLRHSHITHRIEQGHDIRTIRNNVGHSGLGATQYYVHGEGERSDDYLVAYLMHRFADLTLAL